MSTVSKIADRLTDLDGLDRDDRYTQMMRVTKLVEEAGEVAEALIAFHNVNPRKEPGSLEDVVKELADVALTAKVSIQNFGFDAEEVVTARETAVLDRLLAVPDTGAESGRRGEQMLRRLHNDDEAATARQNGGRDAR